jgi:hypothetical protein
MITQLNIAKNRRGRRDRRSDQRSGEDRRRSWYRVTPKADSLVPALTSIAGAILLLSLVWPWVFRP